ncbi:MAG TPA: hypothetical protein DEQ47_05545 [Solibacterales bacterium]|nr:hypothetical protein [Bryobacterales bacterium]
MRKLCLAAMLAVCAPLPGQVQVKQADHKVEITINGQPCSTFVYTPEAMKPYLYPLRAADGTIITRGFPMQNVPGESTDHRHHRGLWFAHSNVNGFDFWNNEPTYKKTNMGTIAVLRISKLKSGKKSGEIDAEMEWREPGGTPLLHESRKMVFTADGEQRVLDFDILLKALKPVTFGDDKDGVFGMRLAPWLEAPGQKGQPTEPKRTLVMTNAEGAHGEKQVWGKRSNWVDFSGETGGKQLGVAIFDNPDNPRHPTYWHARDYGLFAANIFGVKSFTGDKSQDGSLQLKPGETLHFRYRVVIHPGSAQQAKIADQYASYAH